jgi:macrolide transport system ATP-binding/permease protein
MLKLDGIEKKYQMGTNTVYALKGVSLTVEDGDYVAIMGPSGSGKSSLMHILGLLDVPTKGSYQVQGREVSGLSEDQLAVLRRDEIGFIFQQFNLLPRLQARENVALPLLYSERKMTFDRADQLLERVGLGSRADHKPNELSGGQQQRVAIARSLVNRPRMILADEPTGNLDSQSEKEILQVLQELNDSGITVVIVTHEEEVGQKAKRLIRMRDGQIQSDERLRALSSVETSKAVNPSSSGKAGFNIVDIFEYFHQGFKTLAANKVRTGLSMLGILIGVAAVVAMLALGAGAKKAIESQMSSLGSNLLVLRQGAMRVGGVAQETGSSTRLTLEDAAALKNQIPTIQGISPSVQGRVQLTWQSGNWNTQVVGVSADYALVKSSEPQTGRFFSDEENQKRARVAVIGATVVKELFKGQNPIGEMIKINKVNFQVIGILPAKGASGWRDQDDTVLIPIQTAMHRLLGKNYVDSMDIQVKHESQLESTQEQIIEVMLSRRRVPVSQQENAFDVRNMAELQAALSKSSDTMALLLSSIAAISLLVGGIGIMNIMLVSVTERTREIGLRKAIGARRADIMAQFLVESVVVSAVGGLIGILLGWSATIIIGKISGWTMSVSVSSVSLAFLFSASIGIIFGIYPAKKAAALNPIDALRYE